jgi:hypothetical protein
MVQRRALALAGLALAGLALPLVAGCGGGGGDKTFDADGIDITFKYPSKFHRIQNVTFSRSAGAKAAARAGIALDKVNAIIVSRYNLRATITSATLARYKDEVDSVISQLAGTRVSGRRTTYGGLPGYEYVISLKSPPKGQSRMAVLFDRRTEYLINCQSTPPDRNEVEQACRQALDTLATK